MCAYFKFVASMPFPQRQLSVFFVMKTFICTLTWLMRFFLLNTLLWMFLIFEVKILLILLQIDDEV